MDYILKYLLDPLKTGVYNSLVEIDLSGVPQFFKEMAEKTKKVELVKLAKETEKSMHRHSDEIAVRWVDGMVRTLFFNPKECPEGVLKYLNIDPDDLWLQQSPPDMEESIWSAIVLPRIGLGIESRILDSRLFFKIPDVALIERMSGKKRNY